MNILEYLFYNKITKTDFAHQLGLNPTYFINCLNGDKILGWQSCFKVETLTKGKITAKSMRQFSEEQMKRKR